MSRTTQTFREACLVPPGIFPGPGDGSPGTGTTPPISCGPIDPTNPTDPTNPDCSDPAFAAANPSICGPAVSLIISPGVATVPVGGTVQYSAYIQQNGISTPVSLGVVYSGSNAAVATVTGGGLATGVANGVIIVTATWHGYSATASLTVDLNCAGVTTDFLFIIDNSKSMTQTSSGPTRFANALAAAKAVINGIDFTVSKVGIAWFNATHSSVTLNSALTTTKVLALAAIDAITQSQDTTYMGPPLADALGILNSETTATNRVVILISDGEDKVQPAGSVPFISGALALAHLKVSPLPITTVCVGTDANTGFPLLQQGATPGYFFNIFGTTAADTITLLGTLPSKFCSGIIWGYNGFTNNGAYPAPSVAPLIPDIEGGTSSGGGGDSGPWTFTDSYTASCPPGTAGSPVTRTATYISSISMADAQTNAQNQARTAAVAALTCCYNSVVINDHAVATPYPACFRVSGFSGTVTSVTVTLLGFTHAYTSDVIATVVGPQGQAVRLMAGAGGQTSSTFGSSNNATLTFATGGAALPTSGGIPTGTYYPTDYLLTTPMAGPAPTNYVSGPTSLEVFNGLDPNGSWFLYVQDVKFLDAGVIPEWTVSINGIAPCDCSGTPTSLSISSALTGILQCNDVTTYVLPAPNGFSHWDGSGMVKQGSSCVWSTGDISNAVSLNGYTMRQATITLRNDGVSCYYQLDLVCVGYASQNNGTIDDQVVLTAYLPGAFGAGPTGTYTVAPLASFWPRATCFHLPLTLNVTTP